MSRSNQPSLLRVAFETHPTHGAVCTQVLTKSANGTPVNESVIEKVTDRHIAEYPIEWARFQNARPSVRPVGLPLDVGLGMDFELISLFVAHGIADVETFATLSDARIQQVMPGNPILGVNLRNRAVMMVPEARRTPLPIDLAAQQAAIAAAAKARLRDAASLMPTDQADDMESLRRQLAESHRREAEALALVDSMTSPATVSAADEPEDLAGEAAAEAALAGQGRRGARARQAA